MEQALLLNQIDPYHQVKLVTLTKRLVGGNPLVSVHISSFCFCLLIFCFSLLSLRSKSRKTRDTSKILGCSNGTTCPLKRAAVPGDHLTIEHPEFSWGARSTQVSISTKKNVYSCFHLLSDLFSHQGRCEVSLGEGSRRLLTRFFLLFFFWVNLSPFI